MTNPSERVVDVVCGGPPPGAVGSFECIYRANRGCLEPIRARRCVLLDFRKVDRFLLASRQKVLPSMVDFSRVFFLVSKKGARVWDWSNLTVCYRFDTRMPESFASIGEDRWHLLRERKGAKTWVCELEALSCLLLLYKWKTKNS